MKTKLKISDLDGHPLDIVTISNKKDLKKALKNWELKGFF